ncbi:hypothetical protein XFF4834R_chr05840 [Xanthomonas citri pv. fuscans]|nr:hypothetical protein XFF4834R_chr05840 [Xanthomonas citri pv. fuscans]
MKADAGEQFVGQGFIEQGAVSVGSPFQVVTKRKPTGIWRQCGVPALVKIGWTTGLAIRRRGVGRASTHWAAPRSWLNHSATNSLSIGFHRRLRSSMLGQRCTGMFDSGRLLTRKYRCAESRSRSCDEHVAVAFNEAAHF